MLYIYIIIALIFIYIIFVFAPAAVIYRMAFSRQTDHIPLIDRQLKGTRYEQFQDEMLSDYVFVDAVEGEEVYITSRDGLRLHARYLDNGSDKTVIFAHGYRGGAVSNFCVQAYDMYRRGFNLLLITERAHGKSEGKMLGLGCLEQYDILRWIDYEAAKKSVKSIVVYGSSMGASAVGYSSDKITSPKVKALVIDCGFCSPRAQLERDGKIRRLPYPLIVPVIRLLARLQLKTDIYATVADSLKNTKIPCLFLHGDADETVPIEQGMKNYNACAAEKEFIPVKGAQHILAYVAGGEEVRSKLYTFINQYIERNQ